MRTESEARSRSDSDTNMRSRVNPRVRVQCRVLQTETVTGRRSIRVGDSVGRGPTPPRGGPTQGKPTCRPSLPRYSFKLPSLDLRSAQLLGPRHSPALAGRHRPPQNPEWPGTAPELAPKRQARAGAIMNSGQCYSFRLPSNSPTFQFRVCYWTVNRLLC